MPPPKHVLDWALRHEPPEEYAWRVYAPDTAFEIDLSLIGTNTITWNPANLGTGTDRVNIDWGDGTVVSNAYVWYWGTSYTHTYPEIGKYVLRISPVTNPIYSGTSFKSAITRVFRFADPGTSGVKNVPEFSYCANLRVFDDGTLPRWPSGYTSIGNVYLGCTSLAATSLPEWPEGVTSIGSVYSGCTSLAATSLPEWPEGVTSIGSTYGGCTSLTATRIPEWPEGVKHIGSYYGRLYGGCVGITATRIPEWPEGVLTIRGVYNGCRNITGTIPKWPDSVTAIDNIYDYGVYKGCAGLSGAWTEDPAELMPTNITKYGSYTVQGASAALRALFYPDWGGTRTKET